MSSKIDGQDLVLFILRGISARAPSISPDILLEVEIAARAEFGGCKPYIPKHPILNGTRQGTATQLRRCFYRDWMHRDRR